MNTLHYYNRDTDSYTEFKYTSGTLLLKYDICRCLPSDRTRHKVNDAKADYSGDLGSARGVMVIVVGNGRDDTSLNPGRDWLHFT